MRGGAVVVVVGCPSSWNGGSGTLWSWLSWFPPFLSSVFPPPFLPLSPHPSYPPSEQLLAAVVGGAHCGVDGVSLVVSSPSPPSSSPTVPPIHPASSCSGVGPLSFPHLSSCPLRHSFHPPTTPRAVAHEAGGGWCVVALLAVVSRCRFWFGG
jgi:hypothetical protein